VTLASIVIPSRGGAGRLPTLLDALAAQDDPAWEAIVVLDGDIDDSAGVVAAYEQELPVRSIVFPENRGRVAALNAGFEAARGEVLIRCDDDLIPAPDYVHIHRTRHDEGLCGLIGLPINQPVETPYWSAYGASADEQFRAAAYRTPEHMTWRFWGGNVSVPREVHEHVGGYSPAYRGYGYEDVDYGYRLHRVGIPIRLVPELETPHRMAAVTTRIRSDRAYESGAARRVFESRHGIGVLGDPWRLEPSAWNSLVQLVAHTSSHGGLLRMAGLIDEATRRLPGAVARKLIALNVEAAGLAGYRAGERRDHG